MVKIIKSINGLSVKAPQLATNNKGETFWVYTSTKNINDDYFNTIELQKLNSKRPKTTISLNYEMCNYPTIVTYGNRIIVAYERKVMDKNQEIVWKVLSLLICK